MGNEFIFLNQEKTILNELYAYTFLSSRDLSGAPRKRLFGGHSFCIALSPDLQRLDGYLPNPYLKLCNSDSLTIRDGVGISRINFRYPGIEQHTECPEVKITTRVLNELNEAVNRYEIIYKNKKCTVLNAMNMFLEETARKYNKKYEWVKGYIDFTVLAGYKNASNAVDIY